MKPHGWQDEEVTESRKIPSKLTEFDCPNCNANNPWPDGFVNREEVCCHYCGTSFEARFTDEGKVKLKEL